MSVGAVVSHTSRRKPSDGQFVADLAGLFERRRIALGEPHVCEQFEILLTTSDSFRGQLYTLCTAISHMSAHDLSGDELLTLIARALRTPSMDGSQLPPPLRQNFLSGLDAWEKRGASGEDEWPPRKKPVGSVASAPPAAPANSAFTPAPVAMPEEPAPTPSAHVRPGGVPTVQEALEIARIRGGDRPLRAEIIPESPEPMPSLEPAVLPQIQTSAHAPALAYPQPSVQPDANTAAIQELNTLLREIEDRMKSLRPHLVPAEPSTAPDEPPAARPPARRSSVDYRKLDIFKSGVDLDNLKPQATSSGAAFFGEPLQVESDADDAAADAALYARYPYLMSRRPSTVIEAEIAPDEPEKSTELEQKPDSELRLIPRAAVLDEVATLKRPAAPAVVIPDPGKLKTYLAIAVLAGIIVVGAPVSVVMIYHYLHPVYIYDTKPEVTQTPASPQQSADDPNSSRSSDTPATPRKSKSHRKSQPSHKPSTQVWPFPEQ